MDASLSCTQAVHSHKTLILNLWQGVWWELKRARPTCDIYIHFSVQIRIKFIMCVMTEFQFNSLLLSRMITGYSHNVVL